MELHIPIGNINQLCELLEINIRSDISYTTTNNFLISLIHVLRFKHPSFVFSFFSSISRSRLSLTGFQSTPVDYKYKNLDALLISQVLLDKEL